VILSLSAACNWYETCFKYNSKRWLCILDILLKVIYESIIIPMTDPVKEAKKAAQDAEAKIQTDIDHAKGKPSSEMLNKAKIKVRDALG
jgi:hypothetical protein